MTDKRIVIMAGGTGGHIFPALAVADELSQQGWKVLWLGTADRMEAQLVPKHGYTIKFLDIKGARNKGLVRKLLMPLMLLKAVIQALSHINKFRPDVVAGFGGYPAMPGGVAAKLLGKPLLIHEQNAAAGLTNKLLNKISSQTLVAFANTLGLEQKKVVGNPVRQDICRLLDKTASPTKAIRILVVGGSLGAQVLNQQVPVAIAQLVAQGHNVTVMHQSGRDNQLFVEQTYSNEFAKIQHSMPLIEVQEFVADMAQAYLNADLVICRAGALTVSELAVAGVASVLVPLPHAVDDHQTKNASVLVNAGAGVLLPQAQIEQGELATTLFNLIADETTLQTMAAQCRQVAITDSALQVTQHIRKLAE